MPSMRRVLPRYIHTFGDDLLDVFLLLFVEFLGSLILWPLLIVVTILFIPLTLVSRRLLLICCVPCTCSRCLYRCTCRDFATPTESLWIKSDDKPLSYREFKTKIQNADSTNDVAEGTSLMVDDAADGAADKKGADSCEVGTDQIPITISPQIFNHRHITNNVHSLVVIVDKSLCSTKLIQTIELRITQLTRRDSNKKYFPRFSQCLVEIAGGSLVWVDDPQFSISKQIVIHSERLHGQADLQKLLEDKVKQGLPVNAPLWQLVIAPGYGSLEDTVLLWRFHGSMYDGVTIAKVLTYALTDPHKISFRAHNQYFHKNNHLVKFLLTGPMRFLYLLIKRRHRSSDLQRTEKENTVKSGAAVHHMWSERTLDLPVILKNKMLMSMTCNDLLLAMVTGATLPQPITEDETPTVNILQNTNRVLIPFDLWTNLTNRTTLPQGNHMLMLPCPTSSTPEIIPRLWHTEHLFSALKKSGDSKTHLYMMNWLHYLPFSLRLSRALHTYLQGHCTSLIASYDGPKTVDSIEGASIRDIMYFAYPPEGVQHSFNFISYSGTVKLTTLSTTTQLTAEVVDSLVKNMSEQLNEINTMVFQKYFPDGLGKTLCPHSQPYASRVFAEFISKMVEIDSMCRGTQDQPTPSAANDAETADPRVTADVAEGSNNTAATPGNYVHDSVDSSTSTWLTKGSSVASKTKNMGYSHSSAPRLDSLARRENPFQLCNTSSAITTSASLSSCLPLKGGIAPISRLSIGKSKSTSALASIMAVTDEQLLVERSAAHKQNATPCCMHGVGKLTNGDSHVEASCIAGDDNHDQATGVTCNDSHIDIVKADIHSTTSSDHPPHPP